MIRITGGSARGRMLRTPRGHKVRPTADRIREAIFNILGSQHDLGGEEILDLFAGTGILGLEALSRGARRVVFVDESASSCRQVQENLDRCGFGSCGRVRRLALPRGLARLEAEGVAARGVFLDPPYRRGLCESTLEALGRASLVRPGGWLVVEHEAGLPLSSEFGTLVCVDRRIYGSTGVSFFETRTE